MELQGQIEAFRKKGLGVAAISYDSPAVLAAFSRQYGITFPLLSDTASATIKGYGILNTVADEALGSGRDDAAVAADVEKYVSAVSPAAAALVRGTPFPGTFMLDAHGRVTSRFFEEFYRERSTASSIMLRLGGVNAPVQASRRRAKEQAVKNYPSSAVFERPEAKRNSLSRGTTIAVVAKP